MSASPNETLKGGVDPSADQTSSWRAPTSAGPRILQKIMSLDDFEEPARRCIPRPIFGYVVSGADTGASIRANRAAFDEIAFLPSILVGTHKRHQKTILFGRTYDSPFGFSPMGGTSLAAYQGDLVLAKAAAENNIPMILSGAALTTLEAVKEVGPTAWFQAYLPGDEAAIETLLERVARARYETLVVTADVPVASNLEVGVRAGFRKPFQPSLRLAWDGITRPRWLFGMFLRTLFLHGMPHVENMTSPRSPMISVGGARERGHLDRLTWAHLALVRRLWKGSLVIKGVLNVADAVRARDAGVDGIIVSNHGGRQLDGSISPLRVLPGIVAEAGRMTVMLDSTVRRGTDVLKALGLGAQFVFFGRPALYAAAVAGEPGVNHAVKLLRDEIHRDMALLGINSLQEMTRDRLIQIAQHSAQSWS
jgi:L-lactate dehydrogenase (cytochrome)